jgi:hypothetical protein
MNAFLCHFALSRPKEGYAAMFLDGAGWHTSAALRVPKNVNLVRQPAHSRELSPDERVWLYLRARHVSHRLLHDYHAIVEALCHALNALTPNRLRPPHQLSLPAKKSAFERGGIRPGISRSRP